MEAGIAEEPGSTEEPENAVAFKAWLVENGAKIHADVSFQPVPAGFAVVASKALPPDTTVVSCPFSLAITPEKSKEALAMACNVAEPTQFGTDWSERQLICSYICMHWILGRSSSPVLKHWTYLDTLPSPDKLRTPLHFTSSELESFKGTNLYGATLDRQRDWQSEWQQCQKAIAAVSTDWGSAFTWERYLTACTYLSSRAFPSTLLSSSPSLVQTSSSYPVLLPGIDALNHARAQPVSWIVSYTSSRSDIDKDTATISLVLHTRTPRGAELFNNYGPKPNAELILGYGFSLPTNPDDTIVLKIAGAQGRWEVGRSAHGAEPVWDAVLAAVCEDPGEHTPQDELYAAEILAEMAQGLVDRLPPARTAGMRPEVAVMLEHYLEGQRDILEALVKFAQIKERRAIEAARSQGLEVLEEEDEEEEDEDEGGDP